MALRKALCGVFDCGCVIILMHVWIAWITGLDSAGQIWGLQ